MEEGVTMLLGELLRRNDLREDEIVSVIFSQTEDLDADNPARCARTVGFSEVPLFCTQEPRYPDSLPMVVRVLLTAERPAWEEPVAPVYLGGAETLRPDLQTG
jgi:chorismate mutase